MQMDGGTPTFLRLPTLFLGMFFVSRYEIPTMFLFVLDLLVLGAHATLTLKYRVSLAYRHCVYPVSGSAPWDVSGSAPWDALNWSAHEIQVGRHEVTSLSHQGRGRSLGERTCFCHISFACRGR